MNLLQNQCTGLAAEVESTVEIEVTKEATKEDIADKEVTVEREVQAVNRRILEDDKTVLTMTMMIIMMTATIAADKTSGMRHIAIAIQPEDAMTTQAKKASTAEEHADLESLAIRPKGQHIQDTGRGQVPLRGIHSRRPALIGPIHVPEHQDSHPVTTLDITNLIATSSNATPEDNITLQHITNSTINNHTSITVHRAKCIISKATGPHSPDGFNRSTEAGWTCAHSTRGNPYTTIYRQSSGAITSSGSMATAFPWDCRLNPCTGENLLKENQQE